MRYLNISVLCFLYCDRHGNNLMPLRYTGNKDEYFMPMHTAGLPFPRTEEGIHLRMVFAICMSRRDFYPSTLLMTYDTLIIYIKIFKIVIDNIITTC